MLLTKLRKFVPASCQIICISATIGGVDPVLHWLDAVFFCTNYRPVKLQEHVVFGRHIYGLDMPAQNVLSETAQQTASLDAKFQHPSAEAHGFAASVPADSLNSVKSANLTYQRDVAVVMQPKQQLAAQVAIQLALEVTDVRFFTCFTPFCCTTSAYYVPTDSLRYCELLNSLDIGTQD